MSQTIAAPCGKAFIPGVTPATDTDAPRLSASAGPAFWRAIVLVGLTVCAVLLAAGFTPRIDGRPGDRTGLAHRGVAVMERDLTRAVLLPAAVEMADLTETDDGAATPAFHAPLPQVWQRVVAAAFRAGDASVVSPRDLIPPDRPPRHA